MINTKDKTIYWSRQCSFTQEGMNEGWLDEDNITYFKYEKDVIKYIEECMNETNFNYKKDWLNKTNYIDDILEIGYNHYNIYYTEWEDENDLQYKEINGIITEL